MPISWKQHAEETLPRMMEAARKHHVQGDYLTLSSAWFLQPPVPDSPDPLLEAAAEAVARHAQAAWEAGL